MFRDVWDWLQRNLLESSPLGTPENPEILEPDQAPRPKKSARGRIRVLVSLIVAMVVITAPAAFTIWACMWLIDMGTNYEGAAFAWLLLILFAPLTLAFTAAAIVIDGFLMIALISLLFGRRMIVMNFSRTTHNAPRARTVRPMRTTQERPQTFREIPSTPEP